MFNIELPYKSATPMKLMEALKPGSKKYFNYLTFLDFARNTKIRPFDSAQDGKKLLHPPSCTLDAVKVLKHHSQETDDDRK